MSKKSKISQEDLDIFHKAIEGAKPLLHNKTKLSLPTPTTVRPKSIKHPEPDEEIFNFSETSYLDPLEAEEYVDHKQSGISNKILRKLRKGQYNIDAVLDLHGMSVDEARVAVDTFLQQCLRTGVRVVLIIHGKGHHSQTPILKNKINHWLRETNVVLAFCSAAPEHGSRGAMYVLLKRT